MFGGSPEVCKTCLHATVYSVDHVLPRLYSEHNEARWCISSNKVNDNLKSWATVGRDVTEKAQDHRKSTGSQKKHRITEKAQDQSTFILASVISFYFGIEIVNTVGNKRSICKGYALQLTLQVLNACPLDASGC